MSAGTNGQGAVNGIRRWAQALLIAAAVFSLWPLPQTAQAQQSESAKVENVAGKLYPLSIHTPETVHPFRVELAQTDVERARGLMQRKEMAPDHGMLFVFEAEGPRYFWMKDTPLSLDIIFVDEAGKIIRIADHTVPFSEKIIPSMGDALYVLEVLAGTCERLGINVGDQLVSKPLKVGGKD